ncbi:MAG: DUF4209 domain-containing protein [Sedimentisphaerales bacterium]|nr:DUF4209 domain-containing protein [Sedimentisphaerales bacterium]
MSNIRERIEKRITDAGRGYVFTRKDFQDVASSGSVGQILSRMVKDGLIRRIGRGIFDFPNINPALGGQLYPDIDQIAKALARKFRWSILPYGNLAANRLGLSQQVPAIVTYLSNGPTKELRIENRVIYFKHARPKEIYADSYISGLVVQALRYFGKDRVSDEMIAYLNQKLSHDEKTELLETIHYGAEWIYEIVQKIANDCREQKLNQQERLHQILIEYDNRSDRFYEGDIESTFSNLMKQLEDNGQEIDIDIKAEHMAFGFSENHEDDENGWGTYFGPMAIFPNDQGQMMESPSLALVNSQMLDYWANRAKHAKHPIQKARYAGLVWDFNNKVNGKSADIQIAQIRIDAVCDIARDNCHKYETDVITKLKHALELAIRINDKNRIAQVRDSIITYEGNIAEDSKCGLWGFAYDCLWNNKKISLTEDQERKIIADLEERLKRVTNPSDEKHIDPWAAEAAAIRLAKHYRRKNRQVEVRRVILAYGQVFEKISESANAMLAMKWLQDVAQNYSAYGLTEEANRILIRIRGLGPKANSELKPMSAEMEISKEEMAQYVEEMTQGDLSECLARLVAHYIPRRDETEKQVKDIASKALLTSLFQKTIQGHKGRPIAVIGSIYEDIDGHIIFQISQNMQIESVFLRQVIATLIEKFALTSGKLAKYVFQCPLFENDKRSIITEGLRAYFNKDALVSIHLLIPQIENALRNLVECAGGVVLKPSRNSTVQSLQVRTFDELLRDSIILQVLGEDVSLYFRTLFTDPRGINLRNDVCHGLAPAQLFGEGLADRTLHALLVLAQVRKKEGDSNA